MNNNKLSANITLSDSLNYNIETFVEDISIFLNPSPSLTIDKNIYDF